MQKDVLKGYGTAGDVKQQCRRYGGIRRERGGKYISFEFGELESAAVEFNDTLARRGGEVDIG